MPTSYDFAAGINCIDLLVSVFTKLPAVGFSGGDTLLINNITVEITRRIFWCTVDLRYVLWRDLCHSNKTADR